ncbi:T7SS effector LXG polymorphic toxin [Eubacterium sp.]|uniref:T7SS effector LXG polymorphic toxin n=1 Tax=Eubacterium sp. TaxID=142586 RepID=UPI0035216CB2
MENIDIKYSDIQTLMLEYRNNIGKNLNQFSTLMNDINALVGDKVDFAGQGAENIRNYYAQIHLTLLTGIMEAMQAMLSEVAVYKDGYDNIDGSEDFHYNENASEDLHTELEFQSAQMNTYHQEVRENLLNIADLFEEYEPSNESVQFNISETLNEMDRMSEEVESHENNTKKHLNDIKEVLVRLTSMISDANFYSANVEEYDGSLPFKMEDIMAFYNGYKKLDSRISETGGIMERVFKEEDKRLAAEQRKNQGLLEMAEAAMIIVVGGALCVASAGAATPLVAVGFATLGTTTAAFGIADAVEGTQDFYYGAGGDGSTRAVNPLRDTLFMENDDLYNICESVTVTAASVSLPVAAAGTATVKGFARSAFEYGVSGLAGQGSSYLAYKATGDKNIANIANIVGSTVVGSRLARKRLPKRVKITNVKNCMNKKVNIKFRRKISKRGLKTVDTGDLKVVEIKTPKLANYEWMVMGYDKPPYHPNYEVKIVEAGNEKYVRVFSYNADGTSNKLGGWLMKKSDVDGLTSAQIADKYALPKEPTHICDVILNSNFKLQTGIANAVDGWGKGGGQQFDTMGNFIDEDAFINERLLGKLK